MPAKGTGARMSTGPRPGMRPDLAVIGGGVIGLSIAWGAARAGLGSIAVFDPELAHEAPGQSSWAAAGMLAPVTEVHYAEEALLALTPAAPGPRPSLWGH